MPRRLPLETVHPTQLYLSSEKLAGVLEWFDFDAPNYDPLPAFVHDDWYLADGFYTMLDQLGVVLPPDDR